jgi:carnitine 3-dehydrogenase
VQTVACVGAGTIGAGWAALMLAHGKSVRVWDPSQDALQRLPAAIDAAWPSLQALGLSGGADRSALEICDTLEAVLAGAQFVQESAPDDEALKIALIADIEAHLDDDVVIASSSSTFLPSRLGSRCRHPGRVTVGHPFVPVYLIPLVEVVGGDAVDAGVLAWLAGFYASLGQTTITLKREIEGYVANRLQRALFREACEMVEAGVCEWFDVETAVTAGPGMRWAVLGPVMHRHLGGGEGGVRHMIAHFGWAGSPGTEQAFIGAIEDRVGHLSMQQLAQWRDRNLVAMRTNLKPLPE